MKSLLFTTDSTNSTFVTVEYFLSLKIVVIKRANFAVIARKVNVTLSACFRLWLFFIAAQTLNSSYLVSIKLVVYLQVHFIFIHHFVVTKSTTPKLSFANLVRTLFLAASTVVFTAKLFHWLRFIILAFNFLAFIFTLFFVFILTLPVFVLILLITLGRLLVFLSFDHLILISISKVPRHSTEGQYSYSNSQKKTMLV